MTNKCVVWGNLNNDFKEQTLLRRHSLEYQYPTYPIDGYIDIANRSRVSTRGSRGMLYEPWPKGDPEPLGESGNIALTSHDAKRRNSLADASM